MKQTLGMILCFIILVDVMNFNASATIVASDLITANEIAYSNYLESNDEALATYEAANSSALEAYVEANNLALTNFKKQIIGVSSSQYTSFKIAYDAQKASNLATYNQQKSNNLLAYNEAKTLNLQNYNIELAENAKYYAALNNKPIVNDPPVVIVPTIPTPPAVVVKPIYDINMLTYGAKGNGITDDSAKIQAAIDSLKISGGTVYFPAGTYLCNNIKLYSNISIMGDGWNSIIQQKTGLSGYQSLIGINQGGFDTNFPEGNTSLTGTVTNVRISKLNLKGTVLKEGFSESKYLLALTSCSNIVVDQVKFEGFRGDGIFIGVGSTVERHVSNVTIKNCEFDGVNKNNRNGITILDGMDIIIENNVFKRMTRSDMPGAIDIEPNTNTSISWTVLKNITIRNNTFSDLGTLGIVYSNHNELSLMKKGAPSGLYIEGNKISGGIVGIVLQQKYLTMNDSTPNLNFHITGNTVTNCTNPINAQGIRGINVKGNTFKDCGNGLNLGTLGKKVLDVNIESNSFIRLGSLADETGLVISTASRVTVLRNYFEDCGVVSPTLKEGFAIAFTGGASDRITVEGNTVVTPSSLTTMFMYVSPKQLFNSTYNIYRNNSYGTIKYSNLIKL